MVVSANFREEKKLFAVRTSKRTKLERRAGPGASSAGRLPSATATSLDRLLFAPDSIRLF